MFIVFEGIDGSGKSTISKLVNKELNEAGYESYLFFEPTHYEKGKKIREFLQRKINLTKEEVLNLFLEDRKDSLDLNVKPNLKPKSIVILDRYFYSMCAYQADASYSPQDILDRNLKNQYPHADLVFFLEIQPELALERTTKRGEGAEIFENLEFLTQVDKNYRKILPQQTIFINAIKPMNEILDLCKNEILKRL
jgi:dTMP kinase